MSLKSRLSETNPLVIAGGVVGVVGVVTVIGLLAWLITWLVKRKKTGVPGPQLASAILRCDYDIGTGKQQYYVSGADPIYLTPNRALATHFGITLLDDGDYVLTDTDGSDYLALSRTFKSMSSLMSNDNNKDRCVRLKKEGRVYSFNDKKDCMRVQYDPNQNINAPSVVGAAPCNPAVSKFSKLIVELV
jgi:hypothetical protein